MKLLKSFHLHGEEVKIFECWENTMRVVINTIENASISFTCGFDSMLEESEAVKNFLNEHFSRRGSIN